MATCLAIVLDAAGICTSRLRTRRQNDYRAGRSDVACSSQRRSILAMQYRELGRTGWKVSTISFGAWAIGGAWGTVDDRESLAALRTSHRPGRQFHRHGRRLRRWPQRTARGPAAAVARAKRFTSPPRPAGGSTRTRPKATTAKTSPRSSSAASRISTPKRSTSCSSTARRTTCTTGRKCSACSTTSWRPASCATTA